MLNFNLSDKQIALRDKARKFALENVLPVAWHYDELDKTPVFVLKKAFEAGLMNTDIPKQYGGMGYGLIEGAILTEEIAAACPGIATTMFDNSLGLEPIVLSDNEALKEKYLARLLESFKLICFATSEPTMGSDVAGMRCLATPDGDDYILNGTKFWITNGGLADYMTVFATVDPKKQHGGICGFVVERNWDGVSVSDPIPKLGQRNSNTAGINFKDVRVPKENVLAGPGQGFVLAMKTFSRTRAIIGAFAVGAARSALDYAVHYAKQRRAFGSKLSGFQAIQFKLAEMYQKVETSRLLLLKAAWEADQGLDPTVNASVAKFYSSEAALSVVNDALQICGGYGYTKLYPLEKLWRDTRLLTIYEGASEVQRIIVGGHVLSNYEPVMPPLEDLPLMAKKAGLSEDGESTEIAWRCRMCGHTHYGPEPPDECPFCFMPKTAFKQVWPK